jgi:predicted DNA-binding protein with PD1-like motif
MKNRKAGDSQIICLETGERIVETLTAFCGREGIEAGSFTGIGTCRGAELGFFEWERKTYAVKKLDGDFEITALVGNVSVFKGKPHVHAHVTLGDREFRAWAGHLREAETLATCEIVLRPLPGEPLRVRDRKSGTLDLEFS